MAPPPVVTGISPKEGPPGTRVTIRGEFLGNTPTDLVGLTICGCDCLLSAEWKSPNKIIARSGPGKGRGDITVTTLNGGRGTCTVQFRGYHETIGPLKESAVWVEEAPVQGWGSHASNSFHIEDPLGLSVESNEKKVVEEDLAEIFPGGSGDLASESFCPAWWLVENHQGTSFDDLRSGLAYLRRKVHTHKQGQLTFLKGNVGSVMEQLETLENLKNTFERDVAQFGLERTVTIEKAIRECIREGESLFEGVLIGREKAERRRSALGLLQRFRFLFTLPSAIAANMAGAEYDAVISDYSRATNLFGKTDVNLFKKVLAEVEIKINELKLLLREKLYKMPNTLESQKRIIRSLVQLGCDGDPGWEAIEVQARFITQQLNECHTFHITAANAKPTPNSKNSTRHRRTPSGGNDIQSGLNQKVECVEDLTELICIRLPDLWSLGQSYFNGELHMKPDLTKQQQYKTLVVGVVGEMVRLIRVLLLGSGTKSLGPWLPHCLRHIRAVHTLSLQLPQEAQHTVSALIFDLRLQCVKTALGSVVDQVKVLEDQEDWVLIHDSDHGATTKLPVLFENLVNECLNSLKVSVLQGGNREPDLMDSPQAKQELISLLQATLNVFIQVLENLAGSEDCDQSMVASQVSTPTYRQQHSMSMMWEVRVLACIGNWRYIEEAWIKSMKEKWGADLEIGEGGGRLVAAYTEAKADPLLGTIEPSMYIGHFDWDTDLPPKDLRPYAKEIIANIIAVHAELEQVCPWLEYKVISQIVETVGEEMYRLMSCVSRMSPQGAQQATLDILALSYALQPFTTSHARTFFTDALETIPKLKPSEKRLVDELLDKSKHRMSMQLSCFTNIKGPSEE